MNRENKERLTELILEHIKTVIEQEKMGNFPSSGLSVSEAASKLIELWGIKKRRDNIEFVFSTAVLVISLIACAIVMFKIFAR